MKQDTKDWLKRTAGTSALVASPGILAATAIGGPLAGLAVGGAVAAGNVVGSLAYKKYKDTKEDLENRKKFRELQKHVLAQNGILYYQPMVPAPAMGAGDMSLSRSQKKEIRDYANSKAMDIAKNRIDTLANSIRTDDDKVEKLTSKPFFKEMNMSCRDMSCLGKILHKDFNLAPAIGVTAYKVAKNVGAIDALKSTKLGHGIESTKNLISNATKGILTRPGHEFSEDALLSVDEEELKHMRDDIEFTGDPSEKELKKSRYLSMLNEVSRDRLEELLDEGKSKEECVACDPPVSMFSESPNLQSIVSGGDFSTFGLLFKSFTKGAKAASVSKVTEALGKAAPTVGKVAENSSKGGLLGRAAGWVGKTFKNIKEGFTSGTGKSIADAASKGAKEAVEKGTEAAKSVAEKGTEVAKNVAEKASDAVKDAQPNLPGFEDTISEPPKITPKAPETPPSVNTGSTNPKTKLSEIQDRVNQGGTVNKYELNGIKLAGKSQASAAIGEAIGYENLGRLGKAAKGIAAEQSVKAAKKTEQEAKAKQQQ